MKKFWATTLALSLMVSTAFSQTIEKKKPSGTRRQLATIVFAGLGGAILGLSTLSFYGRPQEQLSNIAIGFAVGVIGGTIYVTFRSATTREYYDEKKDREGLPLEPPPQGQLLLPTEDSEPKVGWGPTVNFVGREKAPAYGGSLSLHF